MSVLNSSLAPPNPDTPLAFVPPPVAYQISVAHYVLVASLSILIWDILDNVVGEFHLLTNYPISLNTVAYFMSRIGSLGHLLGSSIFQTAPIQNCTEGETLSNIFYPISLSGSGLLFFFRIRAVYNGDRAVVAFFFVLWLGLVACTTLIPITARGGNVGTTPYCKDTNVPSFSFASILAPLIHDTLVFAAILWSLMHASYVDMDLLSGLKIALLGRYLPKFTRNFLRDGQKYYLITLISNTVTVAMIFNMSAPISLRTTSNLANVALTNIMACRIYRNTRARLEVSEDNTLPNISNHAERPISEIAFGRPQ